MSVNKILHPYYPRELVIPHYKESNMNMVEVLCVLFGGIAALLCGSYYFINRPRGQPEPTTVKRHGTRSRAKEALPLAFSITDKLQFLWFMLCGVIHLFLEGYFVFTYKTIAGDNNLFANIWKEYAKSDSRYMTGDPFVLVMEGITMLFWGVGSFFAAYAIYNRRAWRWPLQFLISAGQLYGDILYYCTTLFEGLPHCDPHPFYLYGYFVLMNLFWVVIPLVLMFQSWTIITDALKIPTVKKAQ